MNAKRINAAAGVILAAQKQRQTAAGVAAALEAAGLLQSPESAAELDRLSDELTGANLALWEDGREIDRLRLALKAAQRGRRQLRARVAELEAALADATELKKQFAELEAYPGELAMLRGLLGVLRVVATHGDMTEVCRLIAEHAADEQAAYAEEQRNAAASRDLRPGADAARRMLRDRPVAEDPHDSPLHHTYTVGRDLPEATPEAPDVTVARWNAAHFVGTPVTAYPGRRPEDDPKCVRLVTHTRSAASVLGGHTAVVWVEGHGACIKLAHVDPRPGGAL